MHSNLQAAIQLRVIDLYVQHDQGIAPLLYGADDMTGWVEQLDNTVDRLYTRHSNIYFGFGTPRRLENMGATRAVR